MTCPARPGSGGPAAVPTASAAGRSKVPANTPRRANSACSPPDSRSKLQSRVLRSVRCRSGRSRAPPVSSPILSSSRASRACGGSSLTLAAASSMASGSPSSRRQISAIAPAFPLVSSKPADAACARCTNRRTEAHRCTSASPPAPIGGTGRGGTGNSCSPLSRNTIRLVTSATTPGAAPSSSATSGAASITCSKLSSTSTSRRARRYDFRSVISLPPEVFSPSAAAIAAVTSSAARTGPSSTNRTPSSKPGPSRCATSTASLLFPTPPGPVRVTRRTPSARTRSLTAAASSSRPTSGVAGTGTAPASDASPAATSPDGALSNRSLSSTARSFSTRRCSPAAAEKCW